MYLVSYSLILITVICGLIYFFLSVWKSMTYWKIRGVKHQKPWPIVGNLGALLRLEKHISYFYEKIYQAFPNERMVGMYEFMTPTLILRDSELIEQVLIREFSNFPDHGPILVENDSLLSKSVFALLGSGPQWRAIRNKLLTSFSTGKMKSIFPDMVEACQALVDNHPKSLTKELLTAFGVESFMNSMLGTTILPAGKEELMRNSMRISESRCSRVIQQYGLTYFPKLSQFFNMTFMPNELHNYFASLMFTLLNQRAKEDVGRNDYAQVLVDMMRQKKMTVFSRDNTKGNQQFDITNDLLISQAFMFFFAGLDTTTLIMLHLAADLSQAKECQEKAREEIRSVVKKFGYTWESVREMKYLDACIQETLRMHPSFQFIVRVNDKPTEIDGVRIDKDTRIIIPFHAMQMDPKYFPNPEKFDPERWLDDDRKPKKFTFLPFSDGPRVCLGKRFALMEIATLFAHILDNYELSLSPQTKLPLVHDPRIFFHSPHSENPICVDLIKIK